MKTPVVLLLAFALVQSLQTFAQRVTNIVMVGDDGVTKNVDLAKSFIVIKQYPDLHFERLDYRKAGPLVKIRSYSDPDLTILHGRYLEYDAQGHLTTFGHYNNNKKTGRWLNINSSGTIERKLYYNSDTLITPDSTLLNDYAYTEPTEPATYKAGPEAWKRYIGWALRKKNTASKAFNDGVVYVNYRVDEFGSVQDVYVSKSVEYILDEECMQLIKDSPQWNPATLHGRAVSAYHSQPISFSTPGILRHIILAN